MTADVLRVYAAYPSYTSHCLHLSEARDSEGATWWCQTCEPVEVGDVLAADESLEYVPGSLATLKPRRCILLQGKCALDAKRTYFPGD